ncbi:nusB family protein, partial [Glaesserella parasuis SW140]
MKVSPRRRARECAVQALYSWYISQNNIEQVELAFVTDQDMQGVDMPYFRKLLRGTVENVDAIDDILRPYLDRADNELDPIERTILRLAGYEL